jgi:hypothetical protein
LGRRFEQFSHNFAKGLVSDETEVWEWSRFRGISCVITATLSSGKTFAQPEAS